MGGEVGVIWEVELRSESRSVHGFNSLMRSDFRAYGLYFALLLRVGSLSGWLMMGFLVGHALSLSMERG